MCHMSPLMGHLSHVIFFIPKKIGQTGGASRWMFCYQRGLPRLVSIRLWLIVGFTPQDPSPPQKYVKDWEGLRGMVLLKIVEKEEKKNLHLKDPGN